MIEVCKVGFFYCAEVCVLISTDTKAFCFVKQHSLFSERWARLPIKILGIENKRSDIIKKNPTVFPAVLRRHTSSG